MYFFFIALQDWELIDSADKGLTLSSDWLITDALILVYWRSRFKRLSLMNKRILQNVKKEIFLTPVFLTEQKNTPAHRLNSSFWSTGQKLNRSHHSHLWFGPNKSSVHRARCESIPAHPCLWWFHLWSEVTVQVDCSQLIWPLAPWLTELVCQRQQKYLQQRVYGAAVSSYAATNIFGAASEICPYPTCDTWNVSVQHLCFHV